MSEEEIQVGDYVAYNVSGNTEYGTVAEIEDEGWYVLVPDDAPQGDTLTLDPSDLTKVQRGQ